jgi:hypothetical protein
MTETYIAHAREDADAAQKLASSLRLLGMPVHCNTALQDEAQWAEKVRVRIEKSPAVIALWSPAANQSDFVKFQATLAHAAGKLVNARAKGSDLPTHLGAIDAVDLSEWDGQALNDDIAHLLRRVRAILPKPHALAPARRPRKMRAAFALSPALKTTLAACAIVIALGALGYAAGRVLNSGFDIASLLPQPRTAPAAAIAPMAAPRGPNDGLFFTPDGRPWRARLVSGAPQDLRHGVSLIELERYSWREIARRMRERETETQSADLQTGVAAHDPNALLLTCIAHLADQKPGFPIDGAKPACAASAASRHPGGLYLSWTAREALGVGDEQARAHLIEAADQGWAPAQRMLAFFLRDGREGFPSDRMRARIYLEGAAANRYPPAEFDLAFFYLRGGDAQEQARARALFSDVLCDADFADLHQRARELAQGLGGAIPCPV